MIGRDTRCTHGFVNSLRQRLVVMIGISGIVLGPAHADGLWGGGSYSAFCAGLPPATRQVLGESIKDF
ncbi:MAG: hypothetical protein H6R26_2658, partial [Proteobacteria bacterium]|nr:hypothetical protein [Pseudomonadota bacterium]